MQQWRHRYREQACGHSEGRKGWDELREQNRNIYITICKIDSQWEFAVGHRQLRLVLCDNLEGWDWEADGREFQEGEDKYIPMAGSC